MSPKPATIYRHEDQNLMFVRTEQRPGSDVPEHLFLGVRNRVVLQVWLAEMPVDMELVVDRDARKQTNEAEWLTEIERHDKELCLALLRKACGWLPKARADDLRSEYVEKKL